MKSSGNLKWGIIITAAVVVVAVILAYSTTGHQDKPLLPYYGPTGEKGEPHYVSSFSLIDQDSNVVTQDKFRDKIYVADFFFTTCRGICPVMTQQMIRAYKAYENNPSVLFISHTVDPEDDLPSVLKEYAGNHSINTNKWVFVTGDKKEIYDLARYSYLVSATEGDGGQDDFIHTENLALVDREGRIRGYYDGTDSVAVKKMIGDIALLLNE